MKMRKHLWIYGWLVFSLLFSVSCIKEPNYVIKKEEDVAALHEAWKQRKDFPKLDKLDYHIPLYAKYLEGLKICLDPGHGGDAAIPRYKRGPTDYREAIMNYKVACFLKEFLEEAGAEVLLTRDGDVDVSLSDRVRIANEWGADLFLSIHHNAFGYTANRTTTWFHLDPDFQPANLDFARNIQNGVADALRLPQIDGVPLKSDQLMYSSGFGVLRGLNMVGCLCEASFFTHPYEEYRLKKDWYLKREAYGHFLGMAHYAWAGIPKAYLVDPPESGFTHEKKPLLKLRVETGFSERGNWGSDRPWIFSDSVTVNLDGQAIPASFDKDTKTLLAQVQEPLSTGEHEVIGGFRNYNGNYSHPLKQKFFVDPPVAKIIVSATPLFPSNEGGSQVEISVRVLDRDGLPVLDGTEVSIAVSTGVLENYTLQTEKGSVCTHLFLPGNRRLARILAASEGRFGMGSVTIPE